MRKRVGRYWEKLWEGFGKVLEKLNFQAVIKSAASAASPIAWGDPENLFRQRLAENPWIHRQREYSPPNPLPKGAIHRQIHRQRVEFSAKGNDSPPESLWQRIWQRSAKSTARSTAKGKISSAKSPLAEIPPNQPPEVHSQVMPGANPLAWNAHLNPGLRCAYQKCIQKGRIH